MTLELSEGEKKKVQTWLASRSRAACPVCAQRSFDIGPLLSTTVSMEPTTGRINYMAGYPLVAIFCNHCAHAMFFNAMAIGVVATPRAT